MKKGLAGITASLVLTSAIVFQPFSVFADAAPGDVVVSLGADLSPTQKQSVLNDLQAPSNAMTVTVTNQEEHQYLGNYIPNTEIGTRSLSSSKITIEPQGTGLKVTTNHINYVTKDMYTNALATAGVKDAEVDVTAPFDVSGTAALTGVIKAYEAKTGTVIPEATKQAANQEMVTTAQLGQQIGQQQAANLVTGIKTQLAQNPPKTNDDLQNIITQQAQQQGIRLTDAQIQVLMTLFEKLNSLHIDWHAVGDQLGKVKDQVQNFINSKQGHNIITQLGDFFEKIWQAIVSLYHGLFG